MRYLAFLKPFNLLCLIETSSRMLLWASTRRAMIKRPIINLNKLKKVNKKTEN